MGSQERKKGVPDIVINRGHKERNPGKQKKEKSPEKVKKGVRSAVGGKKKEKV